MLQTVRAKSWQSSKKLESLLLLRGRGAFGKPVVYREINFKFLSLQGEWFTVVTVVYREINFKDIPNVALDTAD